MNKALKRFVNPKCIQRPRFKHRGKINAFSQGTPCVVLLIGPVQIPYRQVDTMQMSVPGIFHAPSSSLAPPV